MGTSTSTGTLTAGQSRTFNLAPASAVTLTLLPNVRVTITESPAAVTATGLGGNATRVHVPRLPGTFTYGPYPMGGSVVVDVDSNSGSSVSWSHVGAILSPDDELIAGDGGILSLSEVAPVVSITATGTAHTGTGLYGGVKFRAISGTVTITLYDALSATGTPIHTITAAALDGGNGTGYYEWAGNKLLPLATGLHAVLSGGGTFTADVLVQ